MHLRQHDNVQHYSSLIHASRLMMHAKRQLFIESHAGSDKKPSALCHCWAHNGVLPFQQRLWHCRVKTAAARGLHMGHAPSP
jgi:hypothetical protein